MPAQRPNVARASCRDGGDLNKAGAGVLHEFIAQGSCNAAQRAGQGLSGPRSVLRHGLIDYSRAGGDRYGQAQRRPLGLEAKGEQRADDRAAAARPVARRPRWRSGDRYFGGSAFRITTPAGLTITVDPWRNPPAGNWDWYLYDFPTVEVDIGISTYAHFDHDGLHVLRASTLLPSNAWVDGRKSSVWLDAGALCLTAEDVRAHSGTAMCFGEHVAFATPNTARPEHG